MKTRAVTAAENSGIKMMTPKIGQEVIFGEAFENEFWWRPLAGQ